MIKEEDILQAQFVEYVRNVLQFGIIFSVPNEATYTRAAHFARTGMLKGAPDLIWLLPNGQTVMFENKGLKGRARPEQKVFREKAEAIGHEIYTIKDIESLKAKADEICKRFSK